MTYDEGARWLVVRRGQVAVAVNLAAEPQAVPLPGRVRQVLLSSEPGPAAGGEDVQLAGESVAVVELD